MRVSLRWVSVSLLFFSVQCSSDSSKQHSTGGGSNFDTTASVEGALVQLDADVRANATILDELDRALVARMSNADATVLAAQMLHLTEAVTRHERVTIDPAFGTLVQSWSDLPYFSAFAAALAPPMTLNARAGIIMRLPGSSRAAQTSPGSCDPNCAMESAATVFAGQVFTNLGSLVEGFDLISNSASCADQISNLYTCVQASNCDRAKLTEFFGSCSQALGSFAAAAAAAGGTAAASPWLLGALTAAGAVAGILSALDDTSVEQAIQACEDYQTANCCVAQIPCGSTCCAGGYSCFGGGCVRNNAAGCSAGEVTCGAYCCAAGQVCQGGQCNDPPVCTSPNFTCGSNCCSPGQYCDYGTCQSCSVSLCGGTVCCKSGEFCNAVGQCISEPQGGCGALCGTTCCAYGQYCSTGSCLGTAVVCGDTYCDPSYETPLSCPSDCPNQCGNGQCESWESASSCASDCQPICGDNRCMSGELSSCPQDCNLCGDGACTYDETTSNCSSDCFCGNGACDPGENSSNCSTDCGGGGACGDNICDSSLGENSSSCPIDCPDVCGDAFCNLGANEPQTCPADCPQLQCCVDSGGCPSETPYQCGQGCCCCGYGAVCTQTVSGWTCGGG